MAWLFQRATTGLQYTPFEFDQEEDFSRKPYIPFLEGRSPLMPVDYIESAQQLKPTSSRLPDVFTERTHNICSERFRKLAESFEPGVHFFRPIALRRKDGEPLGPHYLWTVGQDIDCILTDDLKEYWRTHHDGSIRFSFSSLEEDAHYKGSGSAPVIIKISKRAVAGKHLWTGGMLGFDNRIKMFMSEQFYIAWRDGNFSKLDFRSRVEEVDKAWTPIENMGPSIDRWQDRENMIANCWPVTPDRRGKS